MFSARKEPKEPVAIRTSTKFSGVELKYMKRTLFHFLKFVWVGGWGVLVTSNLEASGGSNCGLVVPAPPNLFQHQRHLCICIVPALKLLTQLTLKVTSDSRASEPSLWSCKRFYLLWHSSYRSLYLIRQTSCARQWSSSPRDTQFISGFIPLLTLTVTNQTSLCTKLNCLSAKLFNAHILWK